MKKTYASTITLCISCLLLFSCSTPKYTYFFNDGKHLDFGAGKWILNKTLSNSKIFDTELNTTAKKYFKNLLGDSLVDIDNLRQTRLIGTKIDFELTKGEMQQLKMTTDCDYLINIKGKIINEGIGGLFIPSNDPNHYASNEASVSIMIYDLNSGVLISSSEVYAKLTESASHFDNNSNIPSLATSSHTAMLVGAKKLIRKYGKNRLDQ